MREKRTWRSRLLLAGLIATAVCARLPAQVLARPGWAGSGVAPESWWRSAVFYRINPAGFQASTDGSAGDLAGVAQRLDYLQSLGVDALLLETGGEPNSLEGLDDLIREASRYRLRLLLTVTPRMQSGDHGALLQAVHQWLSAGAAGVLLSRVPGQGNASADADYANLVSELNGLLRSFPGERVLLTGPAPQPPPVSSAPGRQGRRRAGQFNGGNSAQLTIMTELPVQPASASALRQSLTAVADANGSSAPGLLRFAADPSTGSPDAAAAATLLLASQGTALFDFGDEIGLDAFAPAQPGAGNPPPVMQWTPLNVGQPPAAPIERVSPSAGQRAAAAETGEISFGAYHPYIHPPPPTLTGAAPASPRVTVDGNIPAALPAPDTLPGFTTGTLPNVPVDGKKINVVLEDRDPRSLLNAYRQLIALHHGNPTLRRGTQFVLGREAQDAVVWVRRAPAGSRTATNVLAAVNLGEQPVTLSLDRDLAAAGMRSGALRALFTWSDGQMTGETMTGETTGALRLPPHAVFVGEMSHAGRGASRAVSRRRRR